MTMAFRARSDISLYINPDTSVHDVGPSEAEMMDTEEEVRLSLQTLNNLRQEAQLTDAVLVVGHRKFNVHRALLAAHSPYFRALFTNGMKETEQTEIELEGIDPDVMDTILHYIYTHEVRVDMETVKPLIAQADIFLISSLIEIGCNFLKRQLVAENSIDIYRFAVDFNKQELAHAAKLYILQHFHRVALKSPDFLELSVDELLALIKDDYLNVRGEEVVFEAAVHWVEHNSAERAQHLPRLLAGMRLGLIARPNFNAKVMGHSLVQDNWDICADHMQCVDQFLEELEADGNHNVDLSDAMIHPRIPRDVMFTIGGWSGGSPISFFETYDARADRWYTHSILEDTMPRAYHATVALDGAIYMIGGFDGTQYYNSVKSFNAVQKTWQEVAPMYQQRCYVSATVLDGSIYAIGGYDGRWRMRSTERYDPEGNQWNKVASMHNRRSDAGASAMSGCVYIVGGFDGERCLDSVEEYNPETNQWSQLRRMSSARSGVSLVTYQDYIYALGGFDGEHRLQSVERFCAVTRRWSPVTDMYAPRSNFAAALLDGMIFVVGGFNGTYTIPHVECYDPVAEEWYDATDMNINRSALKACVLRDLPNVTDYTHYGHARSAQITEGSTKNDDKIIRSAGDNI